MDHDTDLIARVANQMRAKYGECAGERARLRADDLAAGEPRAAARWHLVEGALATIRAGEAAGACAAGIGAVL